VRRAVRRRQDDARLVAAGIHSRRRAADELGVQDPETEFARWLEEEGEAGEGRPERRPGASLGRRERLADSSRGLGEGLYLAR
jgi:hypothetical protein